jgi:hypothetical protein
MIPEYSKREKAALCLVVALWFATIGVATVLLPRRGIE